MTDQAAGILSTTFKMFDIRRTHRRRAALISGLLVFSAACVPAARRSPASAGDSTGSPAGAVRRVVLLRVIATNDFHGALEPTTPAFARGRQVGGAATLAGYFTRARADGVPTVLVDGGDVMQGTLVSNLSGGKATVEYYNQVGYSAAAIGNHEFDWGIDTLRARIADARFAWLGANIFVKGTDTLPSWSRPTSLVTLPSCTAAAAPCDSVRVGFVGIATTATPTTTMPSNVASLRFGDEAEAVDRWVPVLRQQGADFVIVTAHSGAFCQAPTFATGCTGEIVEVARRVRSRPDLIVSGHTHSRVNTVVNGIPIVQAFSGGTSFSIVELERVSPDSVAARVVGQPTAYGDETAPDSAVAALVRRYADAVGPRVNAVVTSLERPLPREGAEYPLGNLIADAQRAATGTQVAMVNNGGIRTELGAGEVRYGELFRVQPFANTLVVLELTGDQLLRALEQAVRGSQPSVHVSGIRVRFDRRRQVGDRVVQAVLDGGGPISPGGRYTVTVNNFMHEGGDGFAVLREAVAARPTGIVDLDALVDYLRSRPRPVSPPTADRWTAEPGGIDE